MCLTVHRYTKHDVIRMALRRELNALPLIASVPFFRHRPLFPAVFNIAGNKYRLVVWINYAYKVIYIRFLGTHTQYDAIDAQTI